MEIIELHSIFQEAIEHEIRNFNESRGRRKELSPKFVESIPKPYRKFGRILELGECIPSEVLPKIVPRMAKKVVAALLQHKPRPCIMAITVGKHRQDTEFLFRFTIPQGKRNNN